VHINHSEDKPEDGSVYEPKHVVRKTTNTSNKSRVLYDYVILQCYTTYIDHIKQNGYVSLENCSVWSYLT